MPEAKEKCEQALKLEDPVGNVGRTWSDAQALPNKENEDKSKIFAEAGPVSQFYRQFGRAMTRSLPGPAARSWNAPECTVLLTIQGNSVNAEGSYEVTTGLLGLLGVGNPMFGTPPPSPVKYSVLYEGTLEGCAIRGGVERKPQDMILRSRSLLAMAGDHPQVLMFFTDDLTSLKVMETGKSNSPRFYSLVVRSNDMPPTGKA